MTIFLSDSGLLTYYQAADGASALSPNQWNVNVNKRHAFKIQATFDGLQEEEQKIVPEVNDPTLETLNSFSVLDSNANIFRTKIINDNIGGEDIALDLDERIITLLMDQSGSMTWNDNEGLRHNVARRLVDRIGNSYPAPISFNVIEFGGTPVEVTLFAIIEGDEIAGDDIQSINSSFFQDNETNFAGVRVVRREGDFPQHPLDGDIITEGFLNKAFSGELIEDRKYYYKAFTFDKNFHFSTGVPISATPRERTIPRGVSNFSSDVLIGSGVARDANTLGIWHFDEGRGVTVYDFSGNKTDLTITPDPSVWIEEGGVPAGKSGLRFDGSNTQASSASGVGGAIAATDELTLMAWVYPFDTTSVYPIIGRQSTESNYLFYMSGTKLGFFNGTVSVDSEVGLTANEWNHVAVTVDYATGDTRFYVNGNLAASETLSSISAGSLTTEDASDMRIDIGFDRAGSRTSDRFHGKIAEVSVHNKIREASYINQHAVIEGDVDNGDRLVVLRYEIPSDFNFSGGKVRIIKNDFKAPSWEEDGTNIYEEDAAPGITTFTDITNLTAGADHFYTIFSQNNISNFSIIADSPTLTISVPEIRDLSIITPFEQPFIPPVDIVARPGNRKVHVKWTNFSTDSRIARVRVYYSSSGFPVVDNITEGSGEIVFEGSVNQTGFVHRDIDNNKGAFYTVVNVDRYGRVSNPLNASAIPERNLDEIGIPLFEIENIRYEIVDNNSLSVQWDNPIEFVADLETFMGSSVLIYAAISDEFGQPISDDTNITMEVTPNFNNFAQIDNVFGPGGITFDFEDADTYVFGVTRLSNGVIKGTLRMTTDGSILSAIRQANFSIQIKSIIPDVTSSLNPDGTHQDNLFEFISAPATVQFNNPWKTEIFNRDGRTVVKECPVPLDTDFAAVAGDFGFATEEKSFDGAFIRSTIPLVARVKLSFQDLPLVGNNTIDISIWNATANVCSEDFDPNPLSPSQTVTTPDSILPVLIGEEEELDETGNPTGNTVEFSFVDIPVTVPQLQQGALLFIEASYSGFTSRLEFFMLFENILKLDLTARGPEPDGVDVAEQQALVYLIDPDNPEDENKRTFPTDLTVVRWNLIKREFGLDRPFYATDNVPLTSGVYSYIRNGIAKNVFFGPASNVILHFVPKAAPEKGIDIIGERYEIQASVVFDELTANDESPIELLPLGSKNFGARMLMEFPQINNSLFADGADFVKLSIVRDPNSTSTRFSKCFRDCAADFGEDVLELSVGQFVAIGASAETEILHGNIIETIDPYSGETLLSIGDGGFIDKGNANVEITDDLTFVYFRINKFILPPPPPSDDVSLSDFAALINPCECLNIKAPGSENPEQVAIGGSTTILINNNPFTLKGGGDLLSGVPPTLMDPREPLEIRFADQRVDGIPSDAFVVDGESVNEIIVEVSFAGKPVPNNTSIIIANAAIETGRPTKLTHVNRIFTRTFIDELIDTENAKSYASLKIDPVSSDEAILEQIAFVATYDKSGEVERRVNVCIDIKWEPGSFEELESVNIFNGRIQVYDEVDNTWSAGFAKMNHPRGYPVLEAEDNETRFVQTMNALEPHAWFRFNETEAPAVVDEITHVHDGEWIGSATLLDFGSVTSGIANSSNKSVFTSGTAYVDTGVEINSNESFSILVIGGLHTSSNIFDAAWVAQLDGSGTGNILLGSQQDDDASIDTVSPFTELSGTRIFSTINGNKADTVLVTDGEDIPFNIIIFTFNASNNHYQFYVNGQKDAGGTLTPVFADGKLRFIRNKDLSTNHTVVIDEIAIFKKVLSDQEAADLYRASGNSRLHAIGGIDSKTISNINEVYSFVDNKWEDKKLMPTPRFGHMSERFNSKIYVMGGISADVDANLIVSRKLETYTPVNDSWETLADMPIVNEGLGDGESYGVCFGIARYLRISGEDRIYVLCGLRQIDSTTGSIQLYNDRVLYYRITANEWVMSEPFEDTDLALYSRISPNVLPETPDLIVAGGAFQDVGSTSLEYITDTFRLKGLDSSIILNDNFFNDLPEPRYRASSVIRVVEMAPDFVAFNDNRHYIMGGSSEKSQTLKTNELIQDNAAGFFPITARTDALQPFAGVGGVLFRDTGIIGGHHGIATAGGFESGHSNNFLKINVASVSSGGRVRLDGKQSASISLDLRDNNGDNPSGNITIIARGFIRFSDTQVTLTSQEAQSQQSESSQRQSAALVDEKLAIYPVLFSSRNVTSIDGKAVITLLPRSDDLLQEVDALEEAAAEAATATPQQLESGGSGEAQIVIETGVLREPYSIVVQLTISDDIFYGQTVEELPQLSDKEETPDPEEIPTEETGTEVKLLTSGDFSNCQSLDIAIEWTGFSRGISLEQLGLVKSTGQPGSDTGASFFSLIPESLQQESSPTFNYFLDFDWMPTIKTRIGDNAGATDETLSVLRNLDNSVPFGASALYDSMLIVARTLSDNAVDDVTKNIYILTDNEANMSIATLDEAIEEINAIDGEKKVPVVNGLFSVVDPITLSARANVSDVVDLNRIADETGGQTVTALSSTFEDDLLAIFIGASTGSMGYGFYEFIYDVGEIISLNSLTVFFELFANTDGRWKMEISTDGYRFIEVEETFKANRQVAFAEALELRFIKFTIILTTEFVVTIADEYGIVGDPRMTQIELKFEKKKVTFLFLNAENTEDLGKPLDKNTASPQQLSVAVNANQIDTDQIQIGVAKSQNTFNWVDYFSLAQPPVNQNGKIFIPIRLSNDIDSFIREPLERVDNYTYKARYGRWTPDATVNVYDASGKLVDATSYKLYPRMGIVAFCSSRFDALSIEIINKNEFRVGVQFTNNSAINPIEVYGMGYVYNTNVQFLPPPQESPPEADFVILDPESPSIFSPFKASWEFRDINLDFEDKKQNQIRWFINNVRIPFLDNRVTWNDLNDPTDPLYTNVFTFKTSEFKTTDEIATEARRKNETLVRAGDKVYFTIRVSDGSLLSETTKSNVVTVLEDNPIAENAVIKSINEDGAVSNVIRGNRKIFVQFNIVADTEVNTSEITWLVNGDEFKKGEFGIDVGIDEIQPGEIDSDGVLALSINNEISAVIVPQTDGVRGEPVTADPVIVGNSLPVVSNVLVGPTNPKVNQNLIVSFTFADYDIDIAGIQSQTNESSVKWFMKTASTSFIEVTEVQNESIVPSSLTAIGQSWKATVIPGDGLDNGEGVESNIIVIT